MLTASTNGLALDGGLDGPETVGESADYLVYGYPFFKLTDTLELFEILVSKDGRQYRGHSSQDVEKE
jgi:hypothetical protein